MSETEATKQRVSRAAIAEQIESIRNATETIALAIDQMQACGAQKSFAITLDALQKKVEKYGAPMAERVKMSDEEKELLRKFREGKITVTEKTEDDEVPASVEDVESAEFNEPKQSKKNKKNRSE